MSASAERPRGSALRVGRALLASCHPVPTAAVSTLSVLLVAGVGLPPERVVLVGSAVLTGQLSIGWSNDAIDAARDRATGRRDKPVATGEVAVRSVWRATGLALVLTLGLSAAVGGPAGVALVLLVGAGWLYNLGLKATLLSGLAYLVGFGSLAAVAYLARSGHPWPPWWVPLAGALLGLGVHIANALPDLRADRETGIRGLPQRLGPRDGVVAMAVVLSGASMVLAVGAAGAGAISSYAAAAISAAGVVTAAVAALAAIRTPESAAAFRVTIAIAALDVVALIAATRNTR